MKPQLYDKILTLLDDSEKQAFVNFYDKAIGDGDIVLRLEEEIENEKQELMHKGSTLSDVERRDLSQSIITLMQILNGDKPDDSDFI